jgi:hypothetical protein
MKIGAVGLIAALAVVGVGVFYLTRRAGNATQADEAAGIITSIGALGQGIGAAAKGLGFGYKDVVNG